MGNRLHGSGIFSKRTRPNSSFQNVSAATFINGPIHQRAAPIRRFLLSCRAWGNEPTLRGLAQTPDDRRPRHRRCELVPEVPQEDAGINHCPAPGWEIQRDSTDRQLPRRCMVICGRTCPHTIGISSRSLEFPYARWLHDAVPFAYILRQQAASSGGHR